MPEKSTTGISDNINKYEVTVSALLSMTIIIIILAVILYLAYITAALYLSAVHDTRPPRAGGVRVLPSDHSECQPQRRIWC